MHENLFHNMHWQSEYKTQLTQSVNNIQSCPKIKCMYITWHGGVRYSIMKFYWTSLVFIASLLLQGTVLIQVPRKTVFMQVPRESVLMQVARESVLVQVSS